jgi:hypothetical protein
MGSSMGSLVDDEVRGGLCMATKELVGGIAADDRGRIGACAKASESFMREFKRRFPAEDPTGVVGTC